MEILLIGILLAVTAANTVICVLILRKNNASGGDGPLLRRLEELRREQEVQQGALRQETAASIQSSVKSLGDLLSANQNYFSRAQAQKLEEWARNLHASQNALGGAVDARLARVEETIRGEAMQTEQKLEAIRQTTDRRLLELRRENSEQLERMREVVDEKLQKTLEERLTRSFQTVEERLEQVYRGLGEMQTLAQGVGDLKKVLAGVKTRGTLGEVQLGAILSEILAPEQYGINVVTRPGSRCPVEFAVKLPAEGGNGVWLPIDSKFPADAYTALRDASESGDPAAVAAAWTVLQTRIKSFAKDIRDKYIDPPHTTEFAVMFLPFEGLYAEVVSRGMVEILQREYRVNIAGPSTMAALLNSLQMGFQAFALRQRSGEVWATLSAVKTEFDRFSDALEAAQQRITQAGTELDRLVGVRTRQIRKTLGGITDPRKQSASEAAGETAAVPLP